MEKQIDDGGPAFPQHGWSSNPETVARMQDQGGMTLRDYFAGQAMQALLWPPADWEPDAMCAFAYRLADAMLKARKGGAQ